MKTVENNINQSPYAGKYFWNAWPGTQTSYMDFDNTASREQKTGIRTDTDVYNAFGDNSHNVSRNYSDLLYALDVRFVV